MHWGDGRQRERSSRTSGRDDATRSEQEGGGLPFGVEIRRASAEDREAILEVVETCFATPGGQPSGRIEERFWHVYAPDRFQPSSWQVAEAGGKIVAAAGFPTIDLNVGSFSFRCAGVTGVCTLPEWRGRGLMSALLKAGMDDIDRRGLPLSLLKGMRHRYRRFGFEDGGRRLGLVLHRRRFPDPGWNDEEVVHVAGIGASTPLPPGFCEGLLAVQKRYLGRALRSPSDQRAMISRRGVHTLWVERDGHAAYALAGGATGPHLDDGFPPAAEGGGTWSKLYEVAGEPRLALQLLGFLMRKGSGSMQVLISPRLNALERRLWERAERQFLSPAGMIRIHDLAGLLASYTPWWKERPPSGADSLALVMEDPEGGGSQAVEIAWDRRNVRIRRLEAPPADAEGNVVRADRWNWVQALFGPLDVEDALGPSPHARRLRELFPLPFWPPRLEQV
ncbi:MAG: GNAT family N-acetyltransferase [Planifilum fimeticola]